VKWWPGVIVWAVAAALIYFIAVFAISGFYRPLTIDLEEKPWLPWARMVFGAVGIPLVLVFSALLTATIYRPR